jgi:hypothetical protein
MAKYGEIVHWIEIPVTVNYSFHEAVPGDRYSPGLPEHITIDFYSFPSEEEIEKLIDKAADNIQQDCWEDQKNR